MAMCYPCSELKEIQKPEQLRNQNGDPWKQGTCPDCGGRISAWVRER